MNTPIPRSCPQCGSAIAPGSLQGLCPNCLALVAFGHESPHQETMTTLVAVPPSKTDAAPPPPARPLLAPNLSYFGDYELLEEIARGGMGVVYRARQVSLNRIVAVKMILSGRLATAADVQRFRIEAEAAANLQHPNIVAIHEVGRHQEQYYFSMDFVDGQNLAQLSREKPMPPVQAAQLIKTLAEAIHYAHQRGTLHRDLKPHNVLIDATGQPRITDFGLAKQIAHESALTQTGTVMGSPSYMSPEQAAGKNDAVGPASDVYSLGAVLYQLLTGRAPFMAESPLATLRKVMDEEPSAPSRLDPSVPPDLETICLKCLEKQPERRYHSARDLAEELGRFLSHAPILAKSASAWRKAWTWCQRNPWAIIGAATIAGLVLLGFAYGLWERIRFLEGRTRPKFSEPILVAFAGYLVLWPAVIFGRWLQARRQRNHPVGKLQLALLAASGFTLIAIGLWADVQCILSYVWQRSLYATWPMIVTFFLGLPLVFCWVGGILIWQAIRRQQAHWSGSAAAEEEWLPRQPVHYSTTAFTAATFANLALFTAAAWLGRALHVFDQLLEVMGGSRAGTTVLFTSFAGIAMTVSFAGWIYATRKISKRPPLVSVVLGLFFAGAAVGWFSLPPPFNALAAKLIFSAILTGLVGSWVLVASVKIRAQEPAEPLPPLAISSVLQWDGRALARALAVVVIALAVVAGAFFRKSYFPFVFFTTSAALAPAVFLAMRATAGKLRELFVSMLAVILLVVVGVPLIGLLTGFHSGTILHLLAAILIGVAAGCALIFFGKIRPLAR